VNKKYFDEGIEVKLSGIVVSYSYNALELIGNGRDNNKSFSKFGKIVNLALHTNY